MTENRQDIHRYFMNIAEEVSQRGTCDRKKVGCVLVKDRRIIATGYNGSISGSEHCDDAGHLMVGDHCVRTLHAEVNAIIQCAKYGISCQGADCYCNTFPCWNCFKILANSGIEKIYYSDDHPSELKNNVNEFSEKLSIPIIRITS